MREKEIEIYCTTFLVKLLVKTVNFWLKFQSYPIWIMILTDY